MLTHRASTILGDTPAEWDRNLLCNLLEKQQGGDWGDDDGDAAVNVLRSTNFTNHGTLDFGDVAIRFFKSEKAKTFGLKESDLLLERSGGGPSQPVGRIGFVPSALPGYWFSNFVQLLRADKEKIDPEFLGWVLLQLNQSGIVERLQHQTTQMRNLDYRDYLKVYLPKPSPTEQKTISHILSHTNEVLAAAEAKLTAARQLKTALMQQLFTRGIPGRHSRLKQTKIGEIPDEWDLSQLRRLFISSTNGHYVPDSDYGSGTPIIRIDTFEDGDFYSRDFDRIRIPNHEIDMFTVKHGDVLFNRVNSIPYVGKVVFVTGLTEPTVFESNMMRLRFDDADLAHYVALALCEPSTKRRIWSMARPAIGQLSINQREVGQFFIPLPKEDERKVIVPLIGAAKETIVACESEVSALRRIKCSLLQNLLTGKVRVKPLETSL
jgi:type I restriction enzyme, S subunit